MHYTQWHNYKNKAGVYSMYVWGIQFTTMLIIQGEVKILSSESYIFRLNLRLVNCWTELSCTIQEQLRCGTMQRAALVALSLILLFAIGTALPTLGKLRTHWKRLHLAAFILTYCLIRAISNEGKMHFSGLSVKQDFPRCLYARVYIALKFDRHFVGS